MMRRLSDKEHAYFPLRRPFRGCVFSEGWKGSSVSVVNSSRNESRSWGFLMVSLRTFLAKDDENLIFRGIENRLHGLFRRFVHLCRFILSGKYSFFESSALFLFFNNKINIIPYFLDPCPGKLTELFIDKLDFGRFHILSLKCILGTEYVTQRQWHCQGIYRKDRGLRVAGYDWIFNSFSVIPALSSVIPRRDRGIQYHRCHARGF